MNITLKRHYKLIIYLLVVIGFCFSIGSTRIIAYNFGEGKKIEIKGNNYTNEIYLYDDSVIHEIKIGLSSEDYNKMIETYQETGEKEYFKTYIVIDGVTIPNVGVRLKGNLTLRQTLGGEGNGQQREFNPPNMDRGMNNENNSLMPQKGRGFIEGMNDMGQIRLPADLEFPENWDKMTIEEQNEFMQVNVMNASFLTGRANRGFAEPINREETTGENNVNIELKRDGFGSMMEGNGGNPPLLIKIDKYIEGQTYQNYAEIALRLGSDKALLSEPITYFVHEEFGQIVPETAFAVVESSKYEPSLYVICEHLDEKYIDKYFSSTNGVLYKAGNFVGFEYVGDDPTLYSEKFTQKTSKKVDDLAPLIRFLKFVSESTDEEFENQLASWLDLDSFIKMMILDDILSNTDSFGGMGSNFYLYYNKDNMKFTMLSWDMNLSMGGMGGMGGRDMRLNRNDQELSENEQKKQDIFEEWLKEAGFDKEGKSAQNINGFDRGGVGGRHGTNVLKERFMNNEKFLNLYDAKYEEIKNAILGQNWVLDKVDQFSSLFTEYNTKNEIIKQADYDSGVERIKNFIQSMN